MPDPILRKKKKKKKHKQKNKKNKKKKQNVSSRNLYQKRSVKDF